jgi:nicotinate dehydrogenase subunit B
MKVMTSTRREFTTRLGAIVVAFSFDPKVALAQQSASLPGSLAQNHMLDAWIRINAEGIATIFPGKVELGQGITTALTQIAAEELDLPLARVRILTTDTSRSPNEGVTAGSQSIEYGGTALRLASAEVRGILLDLAAKRLDVAADTLTVADGTIGSADGRKVTYGELAAEVDLHREARQRRSLPSYRRLIKSSGNRFRVSISRTR